MGEGEEVTQILRYHDAVKHKYMQRGEKFKRHSLAFVSVVL